MEFNATASVGCDNGYVSRILFMIMTMEKFALYYTFMKSCFHKIIMHLFNLTDLKLVVICVNRVFKISPLRAGALYLTT
jgi:hypothetical protein